MTGDKPMEQFEGAKEEMLHADYKGQGGNCGHKDYLQEIRLYLHGHL